ncbi:MAG: response regulator [Syntrophobacteraceae bacterium]
MPFDCHVLLAEDKRVNQDVGRAMLESFGCRVAVASNGQEVLSRMETAQFDMVFMDCQMPLMDGFEATKLLRKMEKQKGTRTPVIALTAHIMEEDRRKCIAAGMDDYLGKPFRMHELSDMLERWMNRAPSSGGQMPATAPSTGGPGNQERLDRKCLEGIRSLGINGAKMLASVIDAYMEDTPILLENLSVFCELQDAVNTAATAHALRSTSANVGAVSLAGLCKQVELIARGNSVEGAGLLIDQIRAEYKKVREALEGELQGGS